MLHKDYTSNPISTCTSFLTLSAHAPEGYCSCPVCLCVCVCVCVFLSAGANPRTGASRRLTEGTSGLSSTFLTIIQRRFL